MPPSAPSPAPPTGATVEHSRSSPCRHVEQAPHPHSAWATTGWPSSNPVTPGPQAATHPAVSWPRVNGPPP